MDLLDLSGAGPWIALVALGAVHGVNPGMGWLFAVALGLQEGEGRAVRRALPPLALGHALAIAGALALAAAVGLVLPPDLLRWLVAALLLAFGLWRLLRGRHPRYGGMRVGRRELATWSFLMASAHGAGLMVLPFVLGAASGHAHGGVAVAAAGPDAAVGAALTAVAAHTAGYLAVTAGAALLVFERLGLRRLRTAWLNVDLLWGASLVGAALLTPFL